MPGLNTKLPLRTSDLWKCHDAATSHFPVDTKMCQKLVDHSSHTQNCCVWAVLHPVFHLLYYETTNLITSEEQQRYFSAEMERNPNEQLLIEV